MKPGRGYSVADVQALFTEALPFRSDQEFVFTLLLESINFCEKLGSTAWSITLFESGFRLNIGQVEAMTCGFTFRNAEEFGTEKVIAVVNLRFLLTGADCLTKIRLAENEEIAEMPYASVGAQHWCYAGSFQAHMDGVSDPSLSLLKSQIRKLHGNHDQFLELACHTSTGKLRQKTSFSKSHCPALYEYARIVATSIDVDTSIAQKPMAQTEQSLREAVLSSLKDDPAKRAARLAVADKVPERYQVTTASFRRNPDVVAEVLLRASGRCEACNQPAPFARAADGTPYLEVHHKVPLAQDGMDCVENAIGLCPNCHRKMHFA
jgi:5-methylcytosine-specific restriction endonuclease McrA